ncbi:MAG: arginyl-tRNA synthetase [Amphiamblys sp. WSBS2006]|nr:MAG: arginyl-tRNA synthetase [Amphiamblys sp. WSBS2006]
MEAFVRDEKEVCVSEFRNFFSRMKAKIAEKIARLVGKDTREVFYLLEKPKKEMHGHMMLPVARIDRNFSALQGKINDMLTTDPELSGIIEKTATTGPFINIHLKKGLVRKEVLEEIAEHGEKYGHATFGKGRRLIIDTSSPNIAKPFHVGHLRSTIIGNFFKNVTRACGYDARTLNYLGDWGKQYGLLAVGYGKYGDETLLEEDPIAHLFDVYVRINADADTDETIHEKAREYFKKMEEGGEEELATWRRFKEKSIAAYMKIYSLFQIDFDVWSGESLYEGRMDASVKELEQKNLLVDSKNALCVDLTDRKLGMAMIRKSDSTSLYLTRDIAAAEDRVVNMGADRLVYVVAAPQDHHFAQLFAIFEKAGKPYARDCVHINYGLVAGMKTRKGSVVFLEDVIEDTKKKILETMAKHKEKSELIENQDHVANVLAVSSISVQDMAAKRVKDYVFDYSRVTSFEGDTGPYLQYTHTRLASIERKAALPADFAWDISLLKEDIVQETVEYLGRYPEIVVEACVGAEPCVIVGYLMKLSHMLSSCIEKVWVAGQEENTAKARLGFYRAAKRVVGNGLRILGLEPLERM